MKVTTLQVKYYHVSRKNFLKNSWFFRHNAKAVRRVNYRRHYGPNTARRLFSERHNGHIVLYRRNKFRPGV